LADHVLSVEGLWKKFAPETRRASAYGIRDISRELFALGGGGSLRRGEFWALRDINFEMARGDALAVVGHNGAGKSTLLKTLYGLLKPDRGRVRLAGRSEAIIELGAGFHPLLTGRENIELGAGLHGLGAAAKRRLVDEVVDFADIGEFVDSPMQTYSTGMRTRLSFALSAHLGADLLLVDEVLAVGDMTFQRKCVNLMRRYLGEGGSLIFISHNTFQIQTVCDRGIVLDGGRQIFTGTAVEAINLLLERRPAQPAATSGAIAPKGPVAITAIELVPAAGDQLLALQPARIKLRYAAAEAIDVVWGFSIWTQDQWVCVAGEHRPGPISIGPGEGELSCLISNVPLVGGRYLVRAAIMDPVTKQGIALRGFHDAPTPFVVNEPIDDASNMKMALHQLIHLDVSWG
jgi:ABC-type polysaccharide/polyol phosphate transport system ATPase subunit